jgi:DENN (AEX-3) domain/ENTH domain
LVQSKILKTKTHISLFTIRTVEAISSQQAALSSRPQLMPHKGEPQKYFLFQMTRYQQHVSSLYGTGPQYERGKPLIAALSCIEIGDEYRSLYKDTDITRFIIPTTLLQSSTNTHPNGQQHQPSTSMLTYNGSILPLLRCVGVYHSIRIMTALLCERRVIFVSSSPTRLAACSNAALSMLTCGLLQWQHLYIPVLPPHLWQYLAAPYPYLIGVLSSAMHKLDKTDGLGGVLMIQLDTNQLEARGMEPSTILQRLPDLCNTNNSQDSQLMVPGGTNVTHFSASDQLAQDLFDVLRNDKKILYGLTGANFAANVVGETATKATIAVKNTFLKLRDKSRQLLQQKSTMTDSGNLNGSGAIDSVDESHFSGSGADGPPGPENSMASDYIYTEGCHNDICEEDCRIALTVFFLCLVGDLKWYLTASAPNSLPVLDRNKFLQQKRAMGDREGTAIFQLLQNFVQTQMLEEFAKARIEDSIKTQPVPSQDTPLFLQCTTYHRQHHIDFVVHDVKRIIQRIVESNPTSASRVTGQLKSNARRNAMTLTSNKGPESGAGDVSRVMAQLVEECRESTSILSDVMSVIWLRLRDSKGMQWKHGLQALQLLRSLLLHGPLAAISEAVDGLDKIRALKYYENMRPVSVLQVRSIASSVYRFLIDRALLFQARRSCIDRRRQLLTPSTIKVRVQCKQNGMWILD